MNISTLFIKLFIILEISLLSIKGFSQEEMDNIDLNRIPQKKIRNFIIAQKAQNFMNFSEIQSSCKNEKNLSGFFKQEFAFIIKENPDKVWNNYITTSPAVSWNGKIISFGLMFSKLTGFIMYRDDNNYTGLETGQVLYLNLKFLRGIYNLAVGLEIISIDDENKSIKFSYLDDGKTKGWQTFHVIVTENGYTKIIYSAFYKSNSLFRDKFLYPHFHHKAIKEFHFIMKNILIKNNKT
ncbi:MAG: hypothetical protein JXB17_12285 [Bacteroidales bacterium]|nr:hypothetical protein [Bacteroidales bacterium]